MTAPDYPQTPTSTDTPQGFTQRSAAEWVTFIAAAVILLGLVGLILFDWQTNQNRPPAFSVAVSEAVRVTDGRYYVPFAITNTGGRIARMVQVTAALALPDLGEETGEQQIDFLSGHETKAGSFVFSHDPQAGQLSVRVASYRLP
ncbi:TIGR02588 family protein [Nodosilinea sp. LEGE 07088]|uniref:TIGR02588 family protein n=1 Tax=Nodosilinea sp. LEGE 07088 TaxID=2777968 RepID=UPI00187FAE97|nr:TIGR02588 family protein [Nodosilinea sp. LEGE 07088]MBE9139703.1 TIGR02588 family protein [Nodosilinea sp. LEGE 07088]